MKKIIKIQIHLLDEQTIDYITYFDNIENKKIKIIGDDKLKYFEEYWLEDLFLIKQVQSIDHSIVGNYIICSSCNQTMEVEDAIDDFEFDQLCKSFDEIHKKCK